MGGVHVSLKEGGREGGIAAASFWGVGGGIARESGKMPLFWKLSERLLRLKRSPSWDLMAGVPLACLLDSL